MVEQAIKQEVFCVQGAEVFAPQVLPEPNIPVFESPKPFSLVSRKLGDLAGSVVEKLSSRIELFKSKSVTFTDLVHKVIRRGSGRFRRGSRSRCFQCRGKHHSFGDKCVV